MAGVLIVAGVVGTGQAAWAEPDTRLRATGSGAIFGAGEPVSVALALRNAGTAPCRAVAAAEVGVTILSVRRDGKAVWPEVSPVVYEDGVAAVAAAGLRRVPVGGELPLVLSEHEGVLRTVTWTPGGSAVRASWPVGEGGSYRVTVAAGIPPNAGLPDDACEGLSGTAVARFTVEDDGPDFVPLILVTGGVLAALVFLLLIVFLVVRSRRSRHVSWAVALLVAATGLPGTAQAKDDSTVVPVGGSKAFAAKLSSCLGGFSGPDGDPAQIMPFLKSQGSKITVRPLNGQGINLVSHTDVVLGTKNSNISWGWENVAPYRGDEVPRRPCTALYHELLHAADFARKGSLDGSQCADLRLSKAEAYALYWENVYRSRHGQPRRRRFYPAAFDNVPKDLKECDKPSTSTWTAPGVEGSEECGPSCGQSNGDPHLRTFDGRYYDFQAAGEFTAVASRDGALRIQVRQQPFPGSDAVSVNTAVAMSVGGSRVGVYLRDGLLRLLVNGRPTPEGTVSLAGGKVARWSSMGQSFVAVSWPDGTRARVRALGAWGLILDVSLSQSRRGAVTGLLGDADGNGGNDVPKDVYGSYADGRRVRQENSLFDYVAGQSTAAFTDRRFPRERVTKVPNRVAAEAACRGMGITSPPVLEACVMDVALTGQASFGDSAAAAQRTVGGAATGPGGATVGPGETLRDGGRAGGTLVQGTKVSYPLELGGATVFRLVEVTGEPRIELVGPFGTDAPGFVFTSNHMFRAQANAAYRIEVSGSGVYGFRLATSKERRSQTQVEARVSGSLDVPGRIDLHMFQPSAPVKVFLAEGTPCSGMSVALVEDGAQPRAYSPSRLCWDITLGELQPGRRYVVVVWSDDAGTGPYGFRVAAR